MRNKLMFENRNLSATLIAIASANPFVLAIIQALFHVSRFATSSNVRNVLDEQACQKGGMPMENVGLCLETLGHKQVYTVTGQAVNDVDLATWCQTIVAEFKKYEQVDSNGVVTNPAIIFSKGDFSNPNEFGQRLTVQWNDTHRLSITRSQNAVENTVDGNGLPIVRNPLGYKVSFIPNEYVARTAVIAGLKNGTYAIEEYVKLPTVASTPAPVQSIV